MTDDKMRVALLGGIGLFGILIIGGLIWAVLAGPSPDSGLSGKAEANLHFSDDNDPAVGPAEAKVVVRMFSDLQCPACRTAEPGLEHAMQKYADKVRFVWDDFPLSTIHPNARAAANAARCAEEQGKFWEYRKYLYDHQNDWASLPAPTQKFTDYAVSQGMSESSFMSCLSSQTYMHKIQADESEGNSNSVGGTPTFFINNVRYEGPMTEVQWDKAIDAALGT